jgi:hypothetical protein
MVSLLEERADALEFGTDSAEGGEWALGDDEWPVSRRVLGGFLNEHGPENKDGVAARMQDARWKLRELLLAKEEEAIPQSATFTHKSSCCELHPGLCITRDSAIYDSAVHMAARMESFFTDDGLAGYFAVLDESIAEDPLCFVYFANRRGRRFGAQVTHVFIECESAGEQSFTFKEDDETGLFAFHTVWSLAKLALLKAPSGKLFLSVAQHTDSWGEGKFALELGATRVELGTYKPPQRRKQDGDLDKLDKKPARKPARKSGGIRYVRPQRETSGDAEAAGDRVAPAADEHGAGDADAAIDADDDVDGALDVDRLPSFSFHKEQHTTTNKQTTRETHKQHHTHTKEHKTNNTQHNTTYKTRQPTQQQTNEQTTTSNNKNGGAALDGSTQGAHCTQ